MLQNDFWGTPLSHNGSHKSYRPLVTATFKLNHLISGFQPFGFHLVNVILHSLVTFLFVALADATLPTRAGVTVAGVVFAAHPVHVEAVAGIVGRADLLAAVFFLLSILSYLRHSSLRDQQATSPGNRDDRSAAIVADQHHVDDNGNLLYSKKNYQAAPGAKQLKVNSSSNGDKSCFDTDENFYLGLSIVFAGCAMFSKEQGITALGVCFITDLVRGLKKSNLKLGLKSSKVKSLVSLAAATVALLIVRAKLMGYASPVFAKADNPASAADSFVTRTLTFLYLPVFNFQLLLCPSKLSFDWSMTAIELIENFTDRRNLETLAFFSFLSIVGFKISRRIFWNRKFLSEKVFGGHFGAIVTSFSIMVLSFLPASNLFFSVGFVVAERVLYIPSIGFSLLVGLAVARASEVLRRRRQMSLHRASNVLTIVLVISLGLRTLRRNLDWKNEENLYRAGIEINPPKGQPNYLSPLKGFHRKGRKEPFSLLESENRRSHFSSKFSYQ